MQKVKNKDITNPAQCLLLEHEAFMNALDKLSHALATVGESAEDLPIPVYVVAREVWQEMNKHLNIHFIKEEEIFFPFIEQFFPSGRAKFQFLHIDHDKLRVVFEEYTNLLQDIEVVGSSNDMILKLKNQATEMIRLFYYHIVAEDTVYLQVAKEKLNEDEARELVRQMRALEERLLEL